MRAASGLSNVGIDLFRAGLWKPRTQPGNFEGVGEKGIAWLLEAREAYGMRICTEVASAAHVETVLRAGLDAVWLGARTVASPFAVQAIADALQGSEIAVMVKNPINPDLKLWLGALERIARSGVQHISAIHRGFSVYGKSIYRNPPLWSLPLELKSQHPELALICDASHICGSREELGDIAQQALDLGYDGIHLEVHPQPDTALSDAQQQLDIKQFKNLKNKLIFRDKTSIDSSNKALLESLRRDIDRLDLEIIDALQDRMIQVESIGSIKRAINMPLFQAKRWNYIVNQYYSKGRSAGLGDDFIAQFLKALHEESIRQQRQVLHRPDLQVKKSS